MNTPPTRRFWQIHLSTAVLMMLAAGIVMWFCVGRYFGSGPARQSEWTEKDGLAARIPVAHSNIAEGSMTVISLDLKNTSDKPVRIFKTATPWEDATINGQGVTEIPKPFVMIYAGPPPPSISDFVELKPTQCLQHEFTISMRYMGELCVSSWKGENRYKVLGRDAFVFGTFSMGAFEVFDMDGNPDSALGGAPIWRGSITTSTIPLSVELPWTSSLLVSVIAYVFKCARADNHRLRIPHPPHRSAKTTCQPNSKKFSSVVPFSASPRLCGEKFRRFV